MKGRNQDLREMKERSGIHLEIISMFDIHDYVVSLSFLYFQVRKIKSKTDQKNLSECFEIHFYE